MHHDDDSLWDEWSVLWRVAVLAAVWWPWEGVRWVVRKATGG